jgi:hypothetical protein
MGGVSGLIEREPTLEKLQLEIGRGLGGDGRLTLVEGAAGIGKTRLLEAAVAAPHGARVLRATAGQYERDLAFGVARRLLGPEAIAASGPVPADVDVGAVLEGLHLRVLELAAERPLLIVVDDLHWADAPSVRLLAYLARRLEGAPLALLAGVRTGTGDLAALREPGLGTHSIVLGPLSAEGSARLLGEVLGGSRADRLAGEYHRATGGNPFLLQTMALGSAADVDSWVRAQLDGLGGDAGAVLEAVAVLGDDAPLATVAAVAERTESGAAAAVDALVAARLLAPDGRRFAHPLVHAAVREAMPAGRRGLVTGRAARLLAEQGDVARAAALLRGRPRVGEAWAGELLCAAGELAMREGAPAEAAELWRACLEEPLGAPERSRRPWRWVNSSAPRGRRRGWATWNAPPTSPPTRPPRPAPPSPAAGCSSCRARSTRRSPCSRPSWPASARPTRTCARKSRASWRCWRSPRPRSAAAPCRACAGWSPGSRRARAPTTHWRSPRRGRS